VLGLVETANEAPQIAASGHAHSRKRLGKKTFDPMLKAKAVAHRPGRLQEKGVHLQPANPPPVTQQPFSVSTKSVR